MANQTEAVFLKFTSVFKKGKKEKDYNNCCNKTIQFRSKNHNLKWVYNHSNHQTKKADLKVIIDEYEDLVFAGVETVYDFKKRYQFFQLIKWIELRIK
ncbi:hypothetical protein BH10BAC1_BH10BAC1_11470 [soil metagenome]